MSYVSSDQEFLAERQRVRDEMRYKVQAALICGWTPEEVIEMVAEFNVEAGELFGELLTDRQRRAAELVGGWHLQAVKPDAPRPASGDGFYGQRAA